MTALPKNTDAYILEVTESARRYMLALRAENEALRALVRTVGADEERIGAQFGQIEARLTEAHSSRLSLDAQAQQFLDLAATLRTQLEEHRRQREILARRLLDVERESQQTAAQFHEVEQQYSNLTNLYVASYRLHETLDRQEMLASLQEIIINIVGSEELAIFEVDRHSGELALLASYGIDDAAVRQVSLNTGMIGRTARSGKTFVAGLDEVVGLPDHEEALTACIPLKLGEHVTGVIAIFRLLKQKPRLTTVDQELFDLLATHAATALYCTGLHATVAGGVIHGLG